MQATPIETGEEVGSTLAAAGAFNYDKQSHDGPTLIGRQIQALFTLVHCSGHQSYFCNYTSALSPKPVLT